jgi:hypothetical protein
MRKLVIATAIIGVLLSPAFAQVKPRMLDEPVKCGDPNFKGTCPQTNEWPDGTTHQDLARVVPSGKEMRIYWIYMLNTDCSAKEEPSLDMRILSQPKHGKAEVTAFSSIASYAHADWKKCNGVKAPGMGIKYKSAEHFTGKDSLQILVFYDGGFAQEVTITINVR